MPSHLWTADALYEHAFPDDPAVVAPILKTDTTALLYGPRGSGKTQLLLELARAVASGGLFLSQFQCRQGPVVFVEADMTAQELQECLALNPTLRALPIHFITFDKRPDMVR